MKHQCINGPHCIVKKMEKWVVFSRTHFNSSVDDYLFYKTNLPPILTDVQISTVMKAIVVHLGWDPKKICVHSLRYGGATMLAAAGLPQYVIAYFGGWTEDSTALRRYTQVSGESVALVSSIMSSGYSKSLEESRIRAFSAYKTS